MKNRKPSRSKFGNVRKCAKPGDFPGHTGINSISAIIVLIPIMDGLINSSILSLSRYETCGIGQPMARRQQVDDTAIAESVTGFAVLVLFLCFLKQGIPHSSQILLEILVIVFLVWLAYRTSGNPSSSSNPGMFAVDRHQTERPVQKMAPAIFAGAANNEGLAPEPALADYLQEIDWFHFEKLVELMYRHHGFSVRRFGGAKAGGSVELIVESPAEEFIVQCNPCQKSKAGRQNIRELLGAMDANKIQRGILITLAGCSEGARLSADEYDIQILSQSDLIELVVKSGLVQSEQLAILFSDNRIFCPQCENELVLKMAHLRGNQLWECSNFPHCKYTLIRGS